jgi:hypothetical protein
LAISFSEEVWDEVGFVCVVEGSDGKVEFVCELQMREMGDRSTRRENETYSDHGIQINRFIAVVLDLHSTSEYIYESFPLEIFWKVSGLFDFYPVLGQNVLAERVLFDFSLSGFLVCSSKSPNSVHTSSAVRNRGIFAAGLFELTPSPRQIRWVHRFRGEWRLEE